MLTTLLTILIIVPLIGFIGCLIAPKKMERTIFLIAILTLIVDFITFISLTLRFIINDHSPVLTSVATLYESNHYKFSLDLYFDWLSAVYLGVALIITTLVFIFSKYYLHRDHGFKRFYSTVILFFTGLSLVTMAGNFEVFLIGWEIIGITSVLLIAFYRDRYLPARNALKVFSIYRVSDTLLLLAVWYMHHLLERSVNFSEFANLAQQYGTELSLLGLILLGVAVIKSAQFPFSYWLPRAMEGPTTSSAIFYGALSVHMGLFLLIRTYPLWEGSLWIRIIICLVGILTAIIASSIARSQSTIKTQIAYASITQIGIMFVEVAIGLPWLALIHFASNAFLRTYQLLISPSIVGYLVHDHFFHFVPPAQRIKNGLLGRIRATLYILSIKEWGMSTIERQYFWSKLKLVGRQFSFLDKKDIQTVSILATIIVGFMVISSSVPERFRVLVSVACALISLAFYVRAYTTKNSATIGWNLLFIGHLFGIFFLMIASGADNFYLMLYAFGVASAFVLGHVCLAYLQKRVNSLDLSNYHGLIHPYKKLGSIFFVICLVFMSFPISSSFLVQDILLSMIPGDKVFEIVVFCLAYLIMGVGIMRLYTKIFFGPHSDSRYETAYKSS